MSICRDWCKHYNGLSNKGCGAGVGYNGLVADRKRQLDMLPCFWANRNKPGVPECAYREWPTEAELKEREEYIQKRIAFVLPLISQIKKQHGRSNVSGTPDCPICGKALHYTVVRFNGHTSGKCETEGCLSWIE